MGVQFRSAKGEDSVALTQLMHSSLAYQGDYASILDGYAVTPEQIARDVFFVAEDAGSIIGFYSLTLGEVPELDLMFVADEAQGTGLGRVLFDHMRAEAAARGIAEVKIVSHPPSAAFYRHMGAVQVGIDPPHGKVDWERPMLSLPTGALATG